MAQDDWTRGEVEAAVADYSAMLVEDLSGARLNKAAHNRVLRQVLRDRSHRSVESKHQNISAVLVEDGFAYLDGYRPAHNYQRLLREVVRKRLLARPDLVALLSRVLDAPAAVPVSATTLALTLVEAPKPEERVEVATRRSWRARSGEFPDYHAREARNRSLGEAGEIAVAAFEHRQLWVAGKRKLADRVEHVAKTKGDGLGFDVLSFEHDGRERLIEVKTSRLAKMTPFFVTKNEVDVSSYYSAAYHLYRLYTFDRSPKLFVLSGALRETCRLEPTVYRAEFA